MIFEKIKNESVKQNKKISAIEKEAGLGNGVIGGWRTSSPNVKSLKAVADVLGVSVDFLIADEREMKEQ